MFGAPVIAWDLLGPAPMVGSATVIAADHPDGEGSCSTAS
jgi:hypothetical protein